MVGRFAEVCRGRGLKVNAGKSTVMVLNGEEGLECEFHIDRIRLEQVSEFKCLGCVLDESGTERAECSREGVAGAIRSLDNARDLQLDCARVLHETLLVLFLCMAATQCYGKRKEKERSRVRAVQMDNLKGFLGIRRMDMSRMNG